MSKSEREAVRGCGERDAVKERQQKGDSEGEALEENQVKGGGARNGRGRPAVPREGAATRDVGGVSAEVVCWYGVHERTQQPTINRWEKLLSKNIHRKGWWRGGGAAGPGWQQVDSAGRLGNSKGHSPSSTLRPSTHSRVPAPARGVQRCPLTSHRIASRA